MSDADAPSQLRLLQTLIIVSEKDALHSPSLSSSFTTQHEDDLGGNDEGDLLRQGGERPHARLAHGTFSSWREDRFLHAQGEKGRSPKALATHVTASVPPEESLPIYQFRGAQVNSCRRPGHHEDTEKAKEIARLRPRAQQQIRVGVL